MKKVDSKRNLLLKASPWVALVALIAYVICIFTNKNSEMIRVWTTNAIFMAVIVIADLVIVKAYLDHNKNLMKSLIGFILCGLMMLVAHYAFMGFSFKSWFSIVKAIFFLLVTIFTVNQFLLSNKHYSRPLILFINQMIMSFSSFFAIVVAIIDSIQYGDNALIFISLLLFALSTMFILLEIEIRVNDYKLQREEKGYVFVQTSTSEEILDEEDMFIDNGLFNALPWIVLAALVANFVFNAIFDSKNLLSWGYSIRYLFFVIKFVSLLILLISYKKHNKDVMKVMLGYLIGTLLFENIFELAFISTSALTSLKSIFTYIMLPISVIFIICHLLLTKTHASEPNIVKAMKIVYVVYVVAIVGTAIGWQVYYIIEKGDNYYFFILKPITWAVSTLPIVTGILTIDTRVNGFKLKREGK